MHTRKKKEAAACSTQGGKTKGRSPACFHTVSIILKIEKPFSCPYLSLSSFPFSPVAMVVLLFLQICRPQRYRPWESTYFLLFFPLLLLRLWCVGTRFFEGTLTFFSDAFNHCDVFPPNSSSWYSESLVFFLFLFDLR